MATASKSTTLYANAGSPYTNATLTAYFGETATSVENNTSTITVSASQQIGNGSWSSSGASTLQVYWFDNNKNSAGKLVKSTTATSQSAYQTISVTTHITVEHKSDGTLSGYAKAVWTKGGSSNYTPNSGNVKTNNTALTAIPRAATITNAPNFTDTDNPTITYSNPLGTSAATLQAGIFDTAGQTAYASYRDLDKTGTTYTFTLTTAERNALLNATTGSNTLPVRFYIKTVIGSTTYYNYKQVNFTVTDANPTFTASYQDTNSTVTTITGNNQLIVRNQSTLQINVASLSAKKSATISTVTATINGVTYSGTISGSTATINVGTLNISDNTTAVVTATDSRNNKANQNLAITVANWELPTGIITLARQSNYYSETDITVDGSYSSVGGHNTMTIKVRQKKVGTSTWSSYTTLQDNVTSTITLDNLFQWDVQVQIKDKFGTTTYNLTVNIGQPLVYYDILKRSVGINKFPDDSADFEVSGPIKATGNIQSEATISGATVKQNGNTVLDSSALPFGNSSVNFPELLEHMLDRATFDGVHTVTANTVYTADHNLMVMLHVNASASPAYANIQVYKTNTSTDLYCSTQIASNMTGYTQESSPIFIPKGWKYKVSGSNMTLQIRKVILA